MYRLLWPNHDEPNIRDQMVDDLVEKPPACQPASSQLCLNQVDFATGRQALAVVSRILGNSRDKFVQVLSPAVDATESLVRSAVPAAVVALVGRRLQEKKKKKNSVPLGGRAASK